MIQPSFSTFRDERVRRAVSSAPPTEPFFARDILARHPELQNDHSALVDLAYEEYCQTRDRGDAVDPKQFAARFPEIEESLIKVLEVHSFVMGHSLFSESESESHWPAPGDMFLGFQLEEEIGKGAFSRVFLAREVELGNRQVVVKVSERGAAEATMLGLLDHPNIVPVYSITTDEVVRLSALCMPYLGRTTGADWIRARFKKPDSRRLKSVPHLQSVIDIGLGVCQGLRFAHEHDVLHCDVKPSNILITHDGEPLLLDFNLSRDHREQSHLVGGTLMYMAPEQLRLAAGDHTASITEKTDVFCLGATLYHLATGEPPFSIGADSRPRLNQALEAALEERQAFLRREPPIPEPLRSTLLRALAFDPDDRMPTAKAFSEQLAACRRAIARPRSSWVGRILLTAAAGWAIAGGFSLTGMFSNSPEPVDSPAGTEKPEHPAPEVVPAPPELSVAQLLGKAFEAEKQGRFAEAQVFYEQVLEQELKNRTLEKEQYLKVKHSIAFCLLMDGQFDKAGDLLDALLPDVGLNSTSAINQAAAESLSCLQQNSPDAERLRYATLLVRKAIPLNAQNAELYHVSAILNALEVRLTDGKSHDNWFRRVTQHTQFALARGLAKPKALAVGYILPEANRSEPLLSIKQAEPDLAPDLELNIPVCSPATGIVYSLPTAIPKRFSQQF